MSVVSSIESVGPCRKRLHIEVPAPAVDAETERVVREYGRKVRLPGFRTGKVPAAVVQQRFKSEIEREVLDRLVPRYWKQAQAESSLDPLLPPSVEDVELKSGEPLVFVATVEVGRRSSSATSRTSTCRRPTPCPPPAEVDEALANLQTRVAEWVDVARPVARGDRVSVETVELSSDQGEPLGASADGRRRGRQPAGMGRAQPRAHRARGRPGDRVPPPGGGLGGRPRRGCAASASRSPRSPSATCRRSTTRWRRRSAS